MIMQELDVKIIRRQGKQHCMLPSVSMLGLSPSYTCEIGGLFSCFVRNLSSSYHIGSNHGGVFFSPYQHEQG